jgi:hypothetical protein
MSQNLHEHNIRIWGTCASYDMKMFCVWNEVDYRFNMRRITDGAQNDIT